MRGRVRTGSLGLRGRRRIRSGDAVSNPSAIASTVVMTKFTHRICSGLRGAPSAMSNTVAPTKTVTKLTSDAVWNRTYFMRLS